MSAPAPRGSVAREATKRQRETLASYVEGGGSIAYAAARLGIKPSTAKRHLADLRLALGLTTEQLIYAGRAGGWLLMPDLEPGSPAGLRHQFPTVRLPLGREQNHYGHD